jgi:Carboxypeptidase regulatory-like domain
MRHGERYLTVAAVLVFAMLAAETTAQQASGIAGVVKDPTGAVLPGVTVEASSPALIEKVRTASTDAAGQYKIIDLVPGPYVVTFSLPGFTSYRREGIELTTNFTAQVNAELKVGAVEETVTVSGLTPLVDVQSTAVNQQMTRATLDAIPTGRSPWALGKILPGITTSGGERGGVDVGGTAGFQAVTLNAHGSRGDNVYQIDGMTVQSGIGNGTSPQYFNDGQFEEYTYTTSAIPAEVAYGGVRIQMTSREGSNAFRGYALGQYAPWQSNNYSSDLQAAGLKVPDGVLKLWDVNGSVGGPIMRDKLWFYVTHRYNGGNFLVGNSFYHDPAVCQQYGTDLEKSHNCQGVDDNYTFSTVGRLTWQATPRNKIAAFYSKEDKQRGHRELAAGVSPESSTPQDMRLSYSAEVKWTAPITNRLLWEAGVSQYFLNYTFTYQPGAAAYQDLALQDLTLSTQWGARPGGLFQRDNYKRYWQGTLSYVTGSHAFKGGFQANQAVEDSYYSVSPFQLVAQFRNGAPSSVLVDDEPVFNKPRHNEAAFFAQDTWTLKRLTINPGIRYDWFHPWIGAQTAPASVWVPVDRQFAEVDSLLAFKNWSPRLGVVYDVFGNGKTAIKGNVSKYIAILGNTSADNYNPYGVLTDQRTWKDLDGNGSPITCASSGNCSIEYNEIGPSTISNFGTRAPRFQDPNLVREQQLEVSASIQHQLLPRVSVSAGYYHRTFYDLTHTVNTLVDVAADYTPVQLPDPRGSGQTITIYNLSPAKFGKTNPTDTTSSGNRLYWDGIDLSANGRIGSAGRLYGGLTMGAFSQNICDVVDPNFTGSLSAPVYGLNYCKSAGPWQPLFKLGGSWPLPLDTQISGTFSSFPGAPENITYGVTRAIYPALTQTSITVLLDDPLNPSHFLPRINQLDLRLAKKLQLTKSRRLMLQFDAFNVFNSNAVLAAVQTFGPTVYHPNTIMQGRIFQLGTQFYF